MGTSCFKHRYRAVAFLFSILITILITSEQARAATFTSTAGSMTVSSPSTGTTVTSPVTVSASCSANSGYSVASIQTYWDGSATPYTKTYAAVKSATFSNSYTLSSGSHSLVVKCWFNNASSALASSTISVSVGTASTGGVTVTSPAVGATVLSPVTFNATAKSTTSYPITAMKIYVDGIQKYSTSSASISNAAISMISGQRSITVQAWDGSGKVYKSSFDVYVPSSAGVSVLGPASGSSVSSPATFNAVALPNSSSYKITAMRIYVDGVSKYFTNHSAIRNIDLPLTTGTRNVVVQAWDSAGTVYKKSLSLNVTSATPSAGVHIGTPTAGSSVSTLVTFNAKAYSSNGKPINTMKIIVDNNHRFTYKGSKLTNVTLPLHAGSRSVKIQAFDAGGSMYAATETISVGTRAPSHVISKSALTTFLSKRGLSSTAINKIVAGIPSAYAAP